MNKKVKLVEFYMHASFPTLKKIIFLYNNHLKTISIFKYK